jgi:hypothetical protein
MGGLYAIAEQLIADWVAFAMQHAGPTPAPAPLDR